jgi:RNA ligase (TIGR02306 family)
MRKLATVRKISQVKSIKDADKICAYRVDGWWVVDAIEKYKVDDLVVYAEPDSWIPTELASFLSKGREPRVFDGISGERLRTARLRGQLSQGLLLAGVNVQLTLEITTPANGTKRFAEGEDVSEFLGIVKYEPPIDAQLAGLVKGPFPSRIPKTDQERVQNLVAEIIAASSSNLKFEVTEKLEGSSMTVYSIDGEFGVCSRNLDLKRDENNSMWKIAIESDIENKLKPLGNISIQGEIIGPGIQNNIYKLSKPQFHVFDVYNVNTGKYLDPCTRRQLIASLGLTHVPVLSEHLSISTIDEMLASADGKSDLKIEQTREGIVFKQVDGGMTFKAISNQYLLKSSI